MFDMLACPRVMPGNVLIQCLDIDRHTNHYFLVSAMQSTFRPSAIPWISFLMNRRLRYQQQAHTLHINAEPLQPHLP